MTRKRREPQTRRLAAHGSGPLLVDIPARDDGYGPTLLKNTIDTAKMEEYSGLGKVRCASLTASDHNPKNRESSASPAVQKTATCRFSVDRTQRDGPRRKLLAGPGRGASQDGSSQGRTETGKLTTRAASLTAQFGPCVQIRGVQSGGWNLMGLAAIAPKGCRATCPSPWACCSEGPDRAEGPSCARNPSESVSIMICDAYDKLPAWLFVNPRKFREHKEWRKRRTKAMRRQRQWWAQYRKYLESPEWAAKRKKFIMERGHFCEDCGNGLAVLHLHHLDYSMLKRERPQDVRLLCVPCHRKRHPKRKFL